MRIIIESTEQERAMSPLNASIPNTQWEVIDGGAPSETLIQPIAASLPKPAEKAELDGGSAPDWLIEAIQSAAPPRPDGAAMITNAGSAPIRE